MTARMVAVVAIGASSGLVMLATVPKDSQDEPSAQAPPTDPSSTQETYPDDGS